MSVSFYSSKNDLIRPPPPRDGGSGIITVIGIELTAKVRPAGKVLIFMYPRLERKSGGRLTSYSRRLCRIRANRFFEHAQRPSLLRSDCRVCGISRGILHGFARNSFNPQHHFRCRSRQSVIFAFYISDGTAYHIGQHTDYTTRIFGRGQRLE